MQTDELSVPAARWAQAKLVAFFVLVNVLYHENVNGKIKVPDVVKHLTLDPNDPARKDPGVKALIERIEQVKTELFGF
ncbi:MAG: hypothetical protein DMF89_25040 [Acidobacteria bacterium]|nr:MAG: hypothetical protein DMF89_25040 [Acidobacteriota bacterium]